MQRLALSALQPAYADKEFSALRAVFSRKRRIMVDALGEMGIRVAPGNSTFYVWGCVEALPAPLNDAFGFFWAALHRRVMTVPGALWGCGQHSVCDME